MTDRSNAVLVVVAFLVYATAGCSADATSTASDAGVDGPSVDANVADVAIASADAAADAPLRELSCTSYCALVAASCSGANAQFASVEQCMHACSDLQVGVYGDSDDSLGCRLAETVAAQTAPALHCPAAGPFGGGLCGDRCDNYCSVIVLTCNGDSAPYTNKTLCWNDCQNNFKFDKNAPEYTDSGNTLNCREGFLTRVGIGDAGDRASGCALAGPRSDACK